MKNNDVDKFNVYQETLQALDQKNISFYAANEVKSTNDLAKAEALKISENLKVYITQTQTAGRGRGSNTWLNSNPGDALLCTFSYQLCSSPQPITGPLTGLSLYHALSSVFNKAALSIKAPNDIYLGEKKVAGLLTEAISNGQHHRLLIGIGLNIFSHPEEVENATALALHAPVTKALWLEFIQNLIYEFANLSRSVLATYLNDSERNLLLETLNQYPLLQSKYINVSPFGDLSTETETISWKSL